MLTKFKNRFKSKIKNSFDLRTIQKFDFDYKIVDNKLIIDLDLFLYKYDLIGKEINISLLNDVIVKVSRGVDGRNVIYNKNFYIDGPRKQIIIDLSKDNSYSYNGVSIKSIIKLTVSVDDKIFFDTKIDKIIKKIVHNKPQPIDNYIMSKKDNYEFFYNFRALSKKNKSKFIFFSILFISLIAIPGYYIFPYIFKQGIELLIYLFQFFLISGVFISICWKFLIKILSGYMNLKQKKNIYSKDGEIYKVSDIIDGKSKIDLHNTTIRIIGYNIEKGRHETGSGKNTSTVEFKKKINKILLYEKIIEFIPKHTNISEYIKGDISMKKFYEDLFPPIDIAYGYGIDAEIEVELINNKLKDKKLIFSNKLLKYEDFIF